ncbi:MAG: hypothetical protein ACKVUS_12680 [Saprospiraceae bacterium]
MVAQLDVYDDLAEVIAGMAPREVVTLKASPVIHPKTHTAEATIKILQLNDPDRIIVRQELAKDGRWP